MINVKKEQLPVPLRNARAWTEIKPFKFRLQASMVRYIGLQKVVSLSAMNHNSVNACGGVVLISSQKMLSIEGEDIRNSNS